MTPMFSPIQGIALLAGYGGVVFAVAWASTRRDPRTVSNYLAADRQVGLWPGAFSIAATWIWAPALFISAREAYTRGLVGLFWFTAPNIACLILFAFFAERMRQRMPEGFTLSAFIRERFSRRVQTLYWIELLGLATCSFAVQLLAGGKVVAALTGLPFLAATVGLAAIAVAYTLFSGIRASIVTDYLQMLLILLVGATLVPWAVARGGGLHALQLGLGGHTGAFTSLVSATGLETALTFGLPVTLGLMAGPFGDQSFWQRAFALRRDAVRPAFIWGAVIFGIVPLTMALLGFIAAGNQWTSDNPELIGLDVVVRLLPAWTLVPFVYMLISGLASTLDSNLCAVSSIAMHDMHPNASNERHTLRTGRASMIALALAALVVANIPGMQILYLFLFYGTLRASTLLPTIVSLTKKHVSEPGMFWGIFAAIVVGLPIFAIGNFRNIPTLTIAGSLLTVLCSGAIVLASSRKPER